MYVFDRQKPALTQIALNRVSVRLLPKQVIAYSFLLLRFQALAEGLISWRKIVGSLPLIHGLEECVSKG